MASLKLFRHEQWTSKRRNGIGGKIITVAASAQKPKKARDKKSSALDKPETMQSTSFILDELFLLSKAFIAKHGTDKKTSKFWDYICLHYQKLVLTTTIMH